VIDPSSEVLISLSEAAKSLPRRRGGKRPHVSCLYRWTTRGCRGVILESIQIGGTRCTSAEALARFFRCLTQDHPNHTDAVVARTPAQRRKAMEAAERELEMEGA
jgi:hypothetical protein